MPSPRHLALCMSVLAMHVGRWRNNARPQWRTRQGRNRESATILRASKEGKIRPIFVSGLRNTMGFDWEPPADRLQCPRACPEKRRKAGQRCSTCQKLSRVA
jgi:hypothetical protein